MPMPTYPVKCYTADCGDPAAFKIASRWSDGVTGELKTYGLACATCLAAWLERARARQASCRLVPGETLGEPCVYAIRRGARDPHLERRLDLETA